VEARTVGAEKISLVAVPVAEAPPGAIRRSDLGYASPNPGLTSEPTASRFR
jgi:hypothetical protein